MVAACSHAASAIKGLELADIFQIHSLAYMKKHRLGYTQRKVVRAILQCRTAALGGHRKWCPQCGYLRYHYHSCRNRHCPKCGMLAKARWLESRQQELLPTPYYHNVFTLPHELNGLILYSEQNRRVLLGLLFHAAAETLLTFGRNNLGGKIGFTMVLHTWDQQLRAHFHLHAVIAGGALAEKESKWIDAGKKFLFPVRALSRVFRGKYVEGLELLLRENRLDLPPQLAEADARRRMLRRLRRKAWVVYSKRPFAGPQKLLDYLGRYTHRVAISNHRLLAMKDGTVTFSYRDRRDGDRKKEMQLPAEEFIHRFLKHVLPSGFMRIRHYGLLASRAKKKDLARCRELLGVAPQEPEEPKTLAQWILIWTGEEIARCPCCGHDGLVTTEISRPSYCCLRSAQFDDFW